MRDFILYQLHRLFNTNTYREMLFQRINEAIYSTYHATNYPKYTGENEMERLANKLKRSERRKNWFPKLGDPLYKKRFFKNLCRRSTTKNFSYSFGSGFLILVISHDNSVPVPYLRNTKLIKQQNLNLCLYNQKLQTFHRK